MEGNTDILVLYNKDLGYLSWRDVRIFCYRYQRFGNPFMEGSKVLLVLDTKDLGTLSWREVRIF